MLSILKTCTIWVSIAMAPHSSTLAWKIPWTEEPGRLQSMGLLGVGHEWTTSLSLFTLMHWEGNGNPLQCSCLENSRDGGAWWAAVSGVAQSQTQLKQLSSSIEYFIIILIFISLMTAAYFFMHLLIIYIVLFWSACKNLLLIFSGSFFFFFFWKLVTVLIIMLWA